jgi:hypothetical protein
MNLDLTNYVPAIEDYEHPTIGQIADATLERLVDELLVVRDTAVQRYLDRHVEFYRDADGWFNDSDVAAAVADALAASKIAANRYVGGACVAPVCEADGIDLTVKIFSDGSIIEEDHKSGVCLAARDVAEYERLRGPIAEAVSAY